MGMGVLYIRVGGTVCMWVRGVLMCVGGWGETPGNFVYHSISLHVSVCLGCGGGATAPTMPTAAMFSPGEHRAACLT